MPHAYNVRPQKCATSQQLSKLANDTNRSLEELIATVRSLGQCGVAVDVDGDGKTDFIAFDTDGDGKLDTLVAAPVPVSTLAAAVDYPRGMFFDLGTDAISGRIVEFGRDTAAWVGTGTIKAQMKIHSPQSPPKLYDVYSGAAALPNLTGGNTLVAVPAGQTDTQGSWTIMLGSGTTKLNTLTLYNGPLPLTPSNSFEVSSFAGPFTDYISADPTYPVPVPAKPPDPCTGAAAPTAACTKPWTVPYDAGTCTPKEAFAILSNPPLPAVGTLDASMYGWYNAMVSHASARPGTWEFTAVSGARASTPLTIRIACAPGGDRTINFLNIDSGGKVVSSLATHAAPWCKDWGNWRANGYDAGFVWIEDWPSNPLGTGTYEIRRNMAGVQNIIFNGVPVVDTATGKISWNSGELMFLSFRHAYLWNNTAMLGNATIYPAYSAVWIELYSTKFGKVRYAPPKVNFASSGVFLDVQYLEAMIARQDKLKPAPIPDLPAPACAFSMHGQYYGRFINFNSSQVNLVPTPARPTTRFVTLDFASTVGGDWNVILSFGKNRLILRLGVADAVDFPFTNGMWTLKDPHQALSAPPIAYLANYTARRPPVPDVDQKYANLSQLALYPLNDILKAIGIVEPVLFNALPLTYPLNSVPAIKNGAALISPGHFFNNVPKVANATTTYIPQADPMREVIDFYNNTGVLFHLDWFGKGVKFPEYNLALPEYILFMQTNTEYPDILFIFDKMGYTGVPPPTVVDLVESCYVLRISQSGGSPGWVARKPSDNIDVLAYTECKSNAASNDSCVTVDQKTRAVTQVQSKPKWTIQAQSPTDWEEVPSSSATLFEFDKNGKPSPPEAIVIQALPKSEPPPDGHAAPCAGFLAAATNITCWDKSVGGQDAAETFIMVQSPTFGCLTYNYVSGGATIGNLGPNIILTSWCTDSSGDPCQEPKNATYDCVFNTPGVSCGKADGCLDKCVINRSAGGAYGSLAACRKACGDQRECFCENHAECGNILNMVASDAPGDRHNVRCDASVTGFAACESLQAVCPLALIDGLLTECWAAAAAAGTAKTTGSGGPCYLAGDNTPKCSDPVCKRYIEQCHCV